MLLHMPGMPREAKQISRLFYLGPLLKKLDPLLTGLLIIRKTRVELVPSLNCRHDYPWLSNKSFRGAPAGVCWTTGRPQSQRLFGSVPTHYIKQTDLTPAWNYHKLLQQQKYCIMLPFLGITSSAPFLKTGQDFLLPNFVLPSTCIL